MKRVLPQWLCNVLIACILLCTTPAWADVIISEFVASNQNGLRDEEGDVSDWIELYNDGTSAVNLSGWRLTDDSLSPSKWVFPSTTLEPRGFLIVFASAKNKAIAGQTLHTNFKLSADGGYLALRRADGSIATEFNPYPAQYDDRPYAVGQTVTTTQLVASNSSLRYLVPTSSTPTNATWTARSFSDSSWTLGSNGVGFESTVSGWLFKTYFSNSSIGDLTQAEAVISTPSLQARVGQTNHPVVNFNNSSSPGHYQPEAPPADLVNEADQFVVEATGTITVPSAGTWTFGVASDDGCRLQIRPVGSATYTNVLQFTGLRGMGDTLGTYAFPTAGDYEIRAVIFENGGGAGGEVFARSGSVTAWDSSFRLIGDTAAGGLAVKSVISSGGTSFGAHIGTNLKALMNGASPQKSSCYVRYSFNNPGALTSLTMQIRYNDGFVAYLNGTEVARRNAPSGTPTNSGVASSTRPAAQVLSPETLDLTSYLNQLVAGSGNVLAIHGLNQSASDGDFLIKAELAQYGVSTSSTPAFYQTATPGSFNTSTVYNKVAPVTANVARGFYSTAQSVTLATGTPGATIRYTFDGSTPSLTSPTSATYTGPITINKTTTLRYAAFKTDFDASDVVTQTYLFPTDVIRQSAAGAAPVISNPPGATQATTAWPTGPVNNQVLDYGMDPDVVNDPTYSGTIANDLKTLPSVSIVTDLPNLFDPAKGIYVNPSGDTITWERPASVELINPDGTPGFQVNCGLRLRGGFSRSTDNPKHAFRLFFRSEYGPGKLKYPLFGSGAGAAQEFDKIDLRTAQNYSWSFQGDPQGTFLGDPIARDMQLSMGQVSSHGRFYHLYVNGQYWGLYNTDERPDANYGATYFGGSPDDYDAIKIDPDIGYAVEPTDGTLDIWRQLWQLADSGLAAGNSESVNNTIYQRLLGRNANGTPNAGFPVLLDPVNLIDEMLIVYWGGNLDAPISNFLSNNSPNNWFGFRNRTGLHGGFKFVLHDSEHTMLPWYTTSTGPEGDRTGPWAAGSTAIQAPQGIDAFSKSNPQYIFQQCIYAQEFKTLVADRVYKHFYNGGVLTPETARALLDARGAEIDRAVVAESARWGDAKVATPLTRATWIAAMDNVRNNFIVQRTGVVLGQLRAKGWYPSFDPPVFSQRGGTVAPGTSITLTVAAGTPAGSTIYFTTDGSDPRVLGGGVSPTAQSLPSGAAIAITTSKFIRTRVRSGTTWSALDEASFYVTQDYSGLALTEINYNPLPAGTTSGDEFEFLELKNTGLSTLDLGGVSFTAGIDYSFPVGTQLAPGAFFVLARNPEQFTTRYPGVEIRGTFTGKLDNGGETLTLSAAGGGTVMSVTYNDTTPWPAAADGNGFTAVPRGSNFNTDDGRDWRASAAVGGSPGVDDPQVNIPQVVINEVLSNSTLPQVDTIELHNPNAAAVDVGNWWLTDDPNTPKKYRIPAGTSIPAGGYMTFSEAQFNPTPGVGPSFALSSSGDDVYLFSGDAAGNLTGYSHGFDFAGAESGVSFGRYVNSVGDEQFPRQTSRTFGAVNAGPLVGPLVLNEIMYHPLAGYDEYVEIRNISGGVVNLFDSANPANTWKVGGINYFFPQGASIPANGVALVVGIDPAAFRTKYNVPAQVQIFGPYAGTLQDSGERLSLEMPQPPVTQAGVTTVPYAIIDTVRYNDKAPWPSEADGQGPSLQRVNSTSYADDPVNWFASGATPGLGNAQNQPPTVNLTAPANNASFTLPATVVFQSAASDLDGSIAKVEYYVDGGKVGEATVSPYTFNWTASGGIHTVQARAIDNSLTVATSSPVTVYVTQIVSQGLKAEYYANRFLSAPVAFTRIDSQVNFSDSTGWVGTGGVGTDQFSVRWTGQILAPSTGTFTFYTNSDDGVRLSVNGQLLVNNWTDHGPTENSATINLVSGQLYTINMEFYESGGGATAQLSYAGPGITKQIIPVSRLYPASTPIIITQPTGLTREQGTDATFTVLASGLNNIYQWRRNGVNIPGETGPTITVREVTQDDGGQYSVVISNSEGFAVSNSVTLAVTVTDTDGDGLQDAWEQAKFGNLSATAGQDPDGDGRNNREEFLAGTDPRNANDLLKAEVVKNSNGQGVKITFTAQSKKSYSVFYKNGLGNGSWVKLQDVTAAVGARTISVTDSSPGSTRFYKVVTPIQ
ncbi:lamin tail domain-containing protein [Verrucomicrobiota bacterium sgz303538]